MRKIPLLFALLIAACSAPVTAACPDAGSGPAVDAAPVPALDLAPQAATVDAGSVDLADAVQPDTAPHTKVPPARKRIMSMGDSNSADGASGQKCPGVYRVRLWQLFKDAGVVVSFVGSQFSATAHSDPVASALGDRNNEALGGQPISVIGTYGVPSVALLRPDVVMLLAGGNDIFLGIDVANAPARLAKLVDDILAAMPPDGRVIVGQLLPMLNNPTLEAQVVAFNAALGPLMAARGSRVTLVDTHTPLLPGGALYYPGDNFHLNWAGYSLVAGVFWDALQE